MRSYGWNVFTIKIWAAILWCAAAFGLFGGDPLSWRLLFAVPFLLASAFHLSLAILEIREGKVRYRRFFRWVDLPSESVVSCRKVWPPWIGYIRLKRRSVGMGTLFFILDQKVRSDLGGSGEYPLLRALSEYGDGCVTLVRQSAHAGATGRSSWLKSGVSLVIGILVSVFLALSQPSAFPGPQDTSASAPLLIVRQVSEFLDRPLVAIVLVTFFLLLAFYMRNRTNGWTFAFLGGLAIPFLFPR